MHVASIFILMLGICILFFADDGEAKCKDKNQNCPELAKKGFCKHEKKAAKMAKRCKLTCNLCSVDTETAEMNEANGGPICKDKKPEKCPSMVEKGYCTVKKQRRKMARHCKKSCNMCSKNSEGAWAKKSRAKKSKAKKSRTRGRGKCRDKGRKCPELMEKGFCTDTKHQKKMQKRCKKSCKLCEEKCRDKGRKCPELMEKGFCTDTKHQKKMQKRCKKSCKLC